MAKHNDAAENGDLKNNGDDNSTTTYQALRAELDEVLARLQDTESDVDDAVALYEQAMRLTARLESYLESAENRVRKVQVDFGVNDGADGNMAELAGQDEG